MQLDVCPKTDLGCLHLTAANKANSISVSGDPSFHERLENLIEAGTELCSRGECGITSLAGALALCDFASLGKNYSLDAQLFIKPRKSK